MLLLSALKSAELVLLQMCVSACRTDMQGLRYPPFDKSQILSALQKQHKISFVVQIFFFILGERCVVNPLL
jgi:hypothetical protein